MKIEPQKLQSSFASPLRYPGGKSRLAGFLAEAIDNSMPDTTEITLVEPFAGGAGASLAILFSGLVNKIHINDLDKAIYSFWKVAVHDTAYLIDKIKRTNITIAEWHNQRAIMSDSSSSQRRLAFATLFLNRTNRSGIIEGRPIGGLKQSGIWHLDARFTKPTIINRLRLIGAFRSQIEITRLDGISLLKKIERRKDADRYFVFLDPPYHSKGKSLYLNHYVDQDHVHLAKYLEKSSLRWIMTYDNVVFIQKLYRDFPKQNYLIQHSAQRSTSGREVVIFSA